jgi:hypothetical protein
MARPRSGFPYSSPEKVRLNRLQLDRQVFELFRRFCAARSEDQRFLTCRFWDCRFDFHFIEFQGRTKVLGFWPMLSLYF